MRILGLLLLVSLVAACDKNTQQDIVQAAPQMSDIVAKVNGEAIYKEEFDLIVNQTVGEYAAFQMNQQTKDKILQSLVLRKLMKAEQLKHMNADDMHALEIQVAAYRDELLTKQYIRDNIAAEPVSNEMVADYYQNNLKQFGQKQLRRFEMVRADTGQNQTRIKQLNTLIQQLSPTDDWRKQVEIARTSGQAIHFITGHTGEKGLLPAYQQVVNGLSKNQTSKVHSINGVLVRFKVTELIETPAKPLVDVKESIRKRLAPLQIKKAVKKQAELLKRQAEVKIYALD